MDGLRPLFGSFWLVLGCFWSFWLGLGLRLAHFSSFWMVLGLFLARFGLFWVVLARFGSLSSLVEDVVLVQFRSPFGLF